MVKKIVIVGIVLLMLVGIFGCSSKDKEDVYKRQKEECEKNEKVC